jgi:hypothetical protein
MNSSKSPSNTGAGPSDFLSAQIMLGPKYQELLDVSFGELVLSATHDKEKEGEAPSGLCFKSSVPSDVSVVSTAPSELSDESMPLSESSDASLFNKAVMWQIAFFEHLSQIHHHAMLPTLAADKAQELTLKVRDYSSQFFVVRAMLPALVVKKAKELTLKVRHYSSPVLLDDMLRASAEKAKELTLKARDYSSRMRHHAMLPALAADKVKGLTRKVLTASKPNGIFVRILSLVVVVAALTFDSSTRYYNKEAIQLSPERAITIVASESSAMSTVQEKMTKLTNVTALKSSSSPSSSSSSSSVPVVQDNKETTKIILIPSATTIPVFQEKNNMPFVQEKKNMSVLQEKKTKATQERALKKLRRKLVQLILEATSYTRGA